MLRKEKIQVLPGVNCRGYDNDGGENCRGYTSGSGHAAVGAVLPGCFGHGDYLRRRRWIFFFAPRQGRQHSNPESRARPFGYGLGADDFLRGGCGCVLGALAGQRTSARDSTRRLLGRAVFPRARSGRPRVVVRASDLAAFQQLHELILIEEKLAKRRAQHWWAHVLSGMG